MLANTIFEGAVDRILDVSKRFGESLDQARIPYRVVGGLAVFLHVDQIDPLAARLTKDVDVGIHRSDLDQIRAAVGPFGFTFRHVAGVDMFLDAQHPGARGAVHVVFVNEKVRPEYVEAVPASEPVATQEGILIAPVVDLVHMKLTSFRLKDKVHIQDMDAVGLITPGIELTLSPVLAARLAEVRATE
ncbi:MAG: hypothetical protein ABL995_11025 [Bryobacteraceae bacterium]